MIHNLNKEFKDLKLDVHKNLHKEKNSQVDIMYVSKEIPMELHSDKDQYTLILEGEGYLERPGKYDLALYKDVLVVIPRNTEHKIVNTRGDNRPLKIMTFYSL